MAHIKHLIRIDCPPEVVYRALTTMKGIQGWWTPDTNIKSEIGTTAKFDFGERYHNEMRITDLQPGKRVAWYCLRGDLEWIGTDLTFDLEGHDGNTVLRFGHNNWRETTDFYASCNFQWGRYLDSLKAFCETGTGNPFRTADQHIP